jgi:hypothetical protein
MSNVEPFPNPPQTLNYKQGNIVRALVKGLQHEGIAADIEQVALTTSTFQKPGKACCVSCRKEPESWLAI